MSRDTAQWFWTFLGLGGVLSIAIGGVKWVIDDNYPGAVGYMALGGLLVFLSFMWTLLRVLGGK